MLITTYFSMLVDLWYVGLAMPEQSPISLFVKLAYWEVYRLNVILTATVFRKVLYIWGFVALLWLGLSALLLFRPSPTQDWAVIMQNASPLKWVLGFSGFSLERFRRKRWNVPVAFGNGVQPADPFFGGEIRAVTAGGAVVWRGVPGDSVGLPHSQLAVLPGTTHVTLIERADWLLPMMTAFLDAPMPEAK